MTIERIEEILKMTGYPVEYISFTPKQMEQIKPPYIIYLVPNTEPITADSKIVSEVNSFRVELYMQKRDRSVEKNLEQIFAENKIIYADKTRVFIQSENMFETIYEFEMEEKV